MEKHILYKNKLTSPKGHFLQEVHIQTGRTRVLDQNILQRDASYGDQRSTCKYRQMLLMEPICPWACSF